MDFPRGGGPGGPTLPRCREYGAFLGLQVSRMMMDFPRGRWARRADPTTLPRISGVSKSEQTAA